MPKATLLSGIQPSGKLMLGHYFGVMKPWHTLQNQYHCLLPLVDLHAITVHQDPEVLKQNSYEMIALYLASGLDSSKCTFFIQSHIHQHAELAWLLNCFTYMGELNRMTQYKEKSQIHTQNINAGLFNYPILMAADILLYQSDVVPVGEDQKQHLELCRNLAERINQIYKKNLFKIPEPIIFNKQSGGRIMALLEPTNKMSKSDKNTNSTVFLLDPPKQIEKKFKQAVTDSDNKIYYDLVSKPGISNLLTIFSLVSNCSIAQLEQKYATRGYGHLKVDIGLAVIDYLEPLQKNFNEIIQDKSYLNQVLKAGAERASEIAEKTISQINQSIGFIGKS